MPAAIETRYSEHLFRSRLEARWAALFDQLNWQWTYEPLDGNNYIPDFLIHGDYPFLVEVKPDITIDALKRYVSRIDKGLTDIWDGDVLIVGSNPTMPSEYWGPDSPAIGLLGEGGYDDGRAWDEGAWRTCATCRQTTFVHSVQSYHFRPCDHYDGGSAGHSPPNIKRLWGIAHEHTRWTP